MAPNETTRAAERAARDSYGRLVAWLTARTRDIAAAEDALSDAFVAALRRWPETGVPDRPEAWLLTAARRAVGHAARRRGALDALAPALALLAEERADVDPGAIPDRRLELMFACAHPAIDPGIRAPLMLQTVLGLEAAEIARALVVTPAAMSARLVRAKTKIRAAGIPFAVPEAAERAGRLGDVLTAIYAIYGLGWEGIGDDLTASPLVAEALHLARLTAALLPEEPEPKGLAALMLYCEARRPARRDAAGRYVPLADQDRGLWHTTSIIEAEGLLSAAGAAGRFGRYQMEAAIQSLHVQAPRGQGPDPVPMAMLYDLLVAGAPSLGAEIARAVAHGAAFGPEAGLAILQALPAARVAGYQPYWAALWDLAARAGRADDAEAARTKAVALARDPVVRAYLGA